VTAAIPLLPARAASVVRGHYGVIYADPPWDYTTKVGNGVAAHHYGTVDHRELAQLPVLDLAAPDCVVFMWATWPKLMEALWLGNAWGFEYKTAAWVWVKQSSSGRSWHFGNGYWSRSNAEVCLLFTRGTPHRKSAGIRQLIIEAGQQTLFPALVAPFTVHSAKPYEAYSRIEALVPGPYLELFARVSAPGWDAWGNQAPNCIDWRPVWRRESTDVNAYTADRGEQEQRADEAAQGVQQLGLFEAQEARTG